MRNGCQSVLFLRHLARQHPLDVLGEDIELEIDQIPNLERVDVCVAFRVGNDPNRETFRQDFGDCEADPVDGNRPFVSYVVGEFGR